MVRLLSLVALVLLAPPLGAQHRSLVRPALQRQIHKAIERGTHYLESRCFRSGKRGPTHRALPLALYAASHSGADRDADGFKHALRRVAKMNPDGTYERACVILALATIDAGEHEKRIAKIANKLVSTQNNKGAWGYPRGEDLSNTQYAVLALWTAKRHGASVPDRVWRRLADGLSRFSDGEGGFGYSHHVQGTGGGTVSMTAAGAACASIALDALKKDDGEGADERRRMLLRMEADAFEWLGRHIAFGDRDAKGRSGWPLYTAYGIERAAALARAPEIGGRDWYSEGALWLVGTQEMNGSWRAGSDDIVSTSFALLFLLRATGRTYDAAITGDQGRITMRELRHIRRRDLARNRMGAGQPRVIVTSTRVGTSAADLVDGFPDTIWASRPTDANPSLRFELAEPQEVDTVLIANVEVERTLALPSKLEVTVNDGEPVEVTMPADVRVKGRLELPEPVELKTLVVRVVETRPLPEDVAQPVPIALGDVEIQVRVSEK